MISELPHGEVPQYQDIGELPIIQLDDQEEKGDALRILVDTDSSNKDIADSITQKLRDKYWWLRPKWQEKGLPAERIDVVSGNLSISVFNFDKPLSEDEIVSLRIMARIFSETTTANNNFQTILLNDVQEVNNYTGEGAFGHGDPESGTFEVFPRARVEPNFRNLPISAFLGTIIHEQAHSIVEPVSSADIINAWIKKLNWRFDPEVVVKTEGGFPMSYFVDDPARCPSEYATFAPNEDFCESFVAALFAPKTLDPERLRFMEDNFRIGEIDLLRIDSVRVDRKSFPNYEMPKIDAIKFYLYQAPRRIIRT